MSCFFFGEVHLSANKSVNPVGVFAGGHVKYVAKHEVQGRVQLLRLLNPSALFETDAQGNKVGRTEIKLETFDPRTTVIFALNNLSSFS